MDPENRVTDDDHPRRRPSAPLAALAGAPRPADGRAGGADRQTAARPGVASSAEPLLARPDRRGGFPGARLPDERGRHAPRRRATLPDLARVRCERRIPRTACPRDAGGAPAQSEPRLRHRHAGGVDDRRWSWRPPRRCRSAGRDGDLVLRHAGLLRGALLAVLVAWGAASILGVPAFMSEAAPAEVAPPLRLGALLAVALYAFAAWHFLRLLARRGRPLLLADRGRPRPPRRGDGDRRLQPRLAPLVVGMASPDGDRLRRGRVRSADRVPTRGLADGCVRRPLPVRDPRAAGSMACRSPLRPRFGAGRGSVDRPHPRSPPHRRRDDRRARPSRARRG